MPSIASFPLEPVWCLYSGGKDSAATAYWLAEQDRLAGVVALDTGIRTPDWRAHIQASAQREGWRCEVYRTPASYEDLVRRYGFPGPGLHTLFMNYLKGRGVRMFKRQHPGATLASGVRTGESARRLGTAKAWSIFEGVRVHAPLLAWTMPQAWAYLHHKGYQRPPAYQQLCISGDCLCGAFASRMEREAVRAFYPSVNARLESLEQETGGTWGVGKAAARRGNPSPLCGDCEGSHAPRSWAASSVQPGVISVSTIHDSAPSRTA